MINIKVSEKSEKIIYAELNNKILGIKELNSSETKKQLMSATFSISALKFIKDTHLLARSAKQSFHHVYEWNKVGSEPGRLFRLIKRQSGTNSIEVYYKFNNSKEKSPISPELLIPGKTGKTVTRSGIFKKKAEVMENGQSVGFTTKRTIAFSGKSGGIVFIPPGKNINIKNPGGRQTSGSFSKHFQTWWRINYPSVLETSGLARKLENNVSRSLNPNGAGSGASKKAIQSTLAPHLIVGSVI